MEWKKHHYDLTIREHHLDSFGHVNNATYIQIFEEARWEMITGWGYGFKEVHELKIGPVILELQTFFKKELRLRQKIRIETQMIGYKGKIGDIRQVIFNEANEVCTEITIKFGVFDLRSRKLIEPSAEWLKATGGT